MSLFLNVRSFAEYDQSNEAPVDYSINQADANWLLKNDTSLRALYLSCHGLEYTDGTFADAVTDGVNWTVYASNVRHSNWEFVYLDACKTASNSSFAFQLGLIHTNTFFMGWEITVYDTVSWRFTCNFFNYAMAPNDDGSRSLYTALEQAKYSTIVDGGYTAAQVKIGWCGDQYWNGWSY